MTRVRTVLGALLVAFDHTDCHRMITYGLRRWGHWSDQ